MLDLRSLRNDPEGAKAALSKRGEEGLSSAVELAEVSVGVDLATFLTASSSPAPPARAGAVFVSGGGTLRVFGGESGEAGVSGKESAILGPPEASGPWNMIPTTLNEPRVDAGQASIPPFTFVTGGFNGDTAVGSTERSIQ